jgi:protein phosphatase
VSLDDDILLRPPSEFPPSSATVEVEFAARSWQSTISAVKSEHYFVVRLSRTQELLLSSLPKESMAWRYGEHAYGMVVADGMGPQGEVASRLAVALLLRLGVRYGRWQLRVDEVVASEIVERLKDFYLHVDSALLATVPEDGTAPLQSTLTAVVSSGNDLFVAHVGHSRAYVLRQHELVQLTRDHSQRIRDPREMMNIVKLTDAAVDFQHVLTNALGTSAIEPHVDVERLTLVDGDTLLLATNGVTDVLRHDDIAAILLSRRTLDEQAEALIATAVERGTSDDATVVLGRYRVPEPR